MSGWNLHRSLRSGIALAALLALPAGLYLKGFAQHIETSTFNQAPLRAKDDPKVVAKGKQIYDKRCASCHSADLRGSDTYPNILRSQPALADKKGELITPIILGQAEGFSDHKYDMSAEDANDVAAYVRSILSQIGSQGRPPGESQRSPSILVGDAEQGKQYFATKCSSCHSADGDLKGFGAKLTSPKMLQSAWLRGTHLGVAPPPVTVKITEPGKPTLEGGLIHLDDFLVTYKAQDGSVVTIRRRTATLPKVEVRDPLEAHRKLWPVYTDKDIHDITAYLVTLK